jgi:hypothetical protein
VKELMVHQDGATHVVNFNYTVEDAQQSTFLNDLTNTPGVLQITTEQCR